MSYRFLPDVALADIAFEASAPTTSGLFEACALAMSDIMVDLSTVRPTVERKFDLEADDPDRLLYDFLSELIVVKDVDSLLFSEYKVEVAPEGTKLTAEAHGEPIDRGRHLLRNDVKAVTMHMFGIRKDADGLKVTVVLDI